MKAKMVHDKWLSRLSGENSIEYILSIDKDDIQLYEYQINFRDVNIIIESNKNVVDASNSGATLATGELLVLVSDDFDCPQNWDSLICEAVKDKSDFVLKTFDGVQKWIVTLPIMDKTYYKSKGYFYHPSYHHMFCDTDMTHMADLEGKLIIRNDIVFTHVHFSTGKVRKDRLNIRADATWEHGEKVYLQRCKEQFGTGKNIFQISEEGKDSIKWLKRKLNYLS